MSDENDWAINRVHEILAEIGFNAGTNRSWSLENTINSWALALKQEREIATLEMEAKYKKIQWPDAMTATMAQEDLIKEHYSGTILNSSTRAYSLGFCNGLKWLKSYVEEKRK